MHWLYLFCLCFSFVVKSIKYSGDVIVYESTPSGIMAAIAASRNTGLKVILLSTSNHIGGMMTGGLSRTDKGNDAYIGGLTKEFFIRNGAVYDQNVEWNLEAHIALNIFMQMLNESNVNIIIDSPILSSNINNSNHIIQSFQSVNGNEYTGKIYIDASYEGDLFAKSGVSFNLGRESNEQYFETLNGRLVPEFTNQFSFYVDPYDENGNLLPLLTPYDNILPGTSDNQLMALNYRLCVTKNQMNRIPFSKPQTYDNNTQRWELLRRQYRILPPTVNDVPSCQVNLMLNDKYDMNNCGAISTDYIGYKYNEYINASYKQREIINEEIKNYTLELLWFHCVDESVPVNVRFTMNEEWGFCKDEFVNTNGFPVQIYIREGRRMNNKDFVFTENTAKSSTDYAKFNQSIGVAYHEFDSHNVQRFACKNASVCYSKPQNDLHDKLKCRDMELDKCSYAWNEGDIQNSPDIPFEIPYMIITPTKDEINNLLVPVGVSASHIGFAALRMEPTWMIMGHSAGTAASILIKNNNYNHVHDIDFIQLKKTLIRQQQYLHLNKDDLLIIDIEW